MNVEYGGQARHIALQMQNNSISPISIIQKITEAKQLHALSAIYPTPPNTRRYPLSYVFSGNYSWGSGYLNYQDSYGFWWSTTANSDSRAFDLGMYSSYLGPQDNSNKASGFALRSTGIRRYPLSYVFSGYYFWTGAVLYDQGTHGYWWSNTAIDNSKAYQLNVATGGLNAQYNLDKTRGFALRRLCGKTKKPPRLSKVDF